MRSRLRIVPPPRSTRRQTATENWLLGLALAALLIFSVLATIVLFDPGRLVASPSSSRDRAPSRSR